MSVKGSCHCRSVRLVLEQAPTEVVACDCSLCSRRGMLWAHYSEEEVGTDGYTEPYCWGDEKVRFHHCPKCGCTTHWQATSHARRKVGVNARLIDGFEEKGGADTSRFSFSGRPVEVRLLEGANG